jgi:rsbT co-antagonist protein RsbR
VNLPADWSLLDSLDVGVLVCDLEGRVLGHSTRVPALLGVDAAALSQLTLTAAMDAHPIAPLPGLWSRVVAGEPRTAGFRGSDGGAGDLEVRARRVELGSTPVVVLELRDVTAWKRSERALSDSKKQLENGVLVRTRELQGKIVLIEQQQRALLELSTPVIQVWDGVLVLPLIGEIDDARAAQLTESVLAAIARTRSRHVVIDLTGVPALGDAAASGMLRTIRAVELLGAACSLTGISAGVAQALAAGDLDWSRTVRIFADLQAALKVVIARG